MGTRETRRVFPTLGPDLYGALRAGGHRKLVLQVPAGLVRNAHDLAEAVHGATGIPVVLLNRACFGACDLPSRDEAPGADAAVVLGHAPIPNVPLPMTTYFVEMRVRGRDPDELAEKVHGAGIPSRIGLVVSVQHLDLVSALRAALERRGHTVESGVGDFRLAYPAQALGCNYTSAEAIRERVDCFLFVGTGRFHPVGLAMATELPVWALDPVQGILEPPIDRASLLKGRYLLIARARDAKRWGILVSSFVGQDRSATARALKERAERRGWQAELLVFGRLDPQDLIGRDIDAYVNTACPRIALDDSPLYGKPLLTPPEFLMVLGEIPLEPYRFDTYH